IPSSRTGCNWKATARGRSWVRGSSWPCPTRRWPPAGGWIAGSTPTDGACRRCRPCCGVSVTSRDAPRGRRKEGTSVLDTVLFAIFPYVAVILAVVMGVYRYVQDPFSQSSFSSQLLENRRLFWGSVGWHYAILIILLAHLLGFLFPAWWAEVIANPLRLYPLEIIGLALALPAVTALLVLTIRRL